MRERLCRARPVDLEVRGDGRTIVGLAVPFDEPTVIVERGRSYTEVFRRGAFARTIAERGPAKVKLLAQHDRERLPVGRATVLREDPAGLYGEFHVSATRAGDEVLALVRDGALDALSVGFRPIRDRWSEDRSTVERLEVALAEVSVVAWPAYEGAVIHAVRGDRSLPVQLARRQLNLRKDFYR